VINSLNKYSHNQIFSKWSLRLGLPDTLNITSHYITDSVAIKLNSQQKLNQYYSSFAGLVSTSSLNRDPVSNDWISLNSPDRTYMYYVTTFNIDTLSLGETTSSLRMRDSSGISTICIFSLAENSKMVASTTKHEVGHAVGLEHTFPSLSGVNYINFSPKIPIFTTQNFMDYWYKNVPEVRNTFFFYQWIFSNRY
jgi:hypothetical protein